MMRSSATRTDATVAVRFRAMGCRCQVVAVPEDPARAGARLASAEALVRVVERALSRFDPESELSRLNAGAGRWVRVSPLLWGALGHALAGARATHGLYDPTVLPTLKAWGYDRSFEQVRGRRISTGGSATPAGAWREIRTDPATGSVYLPPGVQVDLGGMAKGWTADLVGRALADLGPVLVDLGGDICALGSPPGEEGWPVAVADPFNPEADVALLVIRNAGVATSGVDYRRWRTDRGTAHHIIDPRTGRPSDTDVLTATVVAPSAFLADLLALVCLLLGSRQALQTLAKMEGVEALLITRDARVTWSTGMEDHIAEFYGVGGGAR